MRAAANELLAELSLRRSGQQVRWRRMAEGCARPLRRGRSSGCLGASMDVKTESERFLPLQVRPVCCFEGNASPLLSGELVAVRHSATQRWALNAEVDSHRCNARAGDSTYGDPPHAPGSVSWLRAPRCITDLLEMLSQTLPRWCFAAAELRLRVLASV